MIFPPHPCASAIPRFSTLISHSLIMELRMTCRERGTSEQVGWNNNSNTTDFDSKWASKFAQIFLVWVCVLHRCFEGKINQLQLALGCRHLTVSHIRKKAARSQVAGISDKWSRTWVWCSQPDRLSLFNTLLRGRRSGSWAAVRQSAASTSCLPRVAFYLMLGRELLHVGVKTPEARQEVVDHHLLGNDCGRESQGAEGCWCRRLMRVWKEDTDLYFNLMIKIMNKRRKSPMKVVYTLG